MRKGDPVSIALKTSFQYTSSRYTLWLVYFDSFYQHLVSILSVCLIKVKLSTVECPNVQWSRNVEVVKAIASQPRFTCCLLMSLKASERRGLPEDTAPGAGRQMFFLLPVKVGSSWGSLLPSDVYNTVVCSCSNFLESTIELAKLLSQVQSDSVHQKAFCFAQACTRGNPQHQPTQNTLRHCKPAIPCFINDVKKRNSRNFHSLATYIFSCKIYSILRGGLQYSKRFQSTKTTCKTTARSSKHTVK